MAGDHMVQFDQSNTFEHVRVLLIFLCYLFVWLHLSRLRGDFPHGVSLCDAILSVQIHPVCAKGAQYGRVCPLPVAEARCII
jgi:hypothetical protein